MPRPCSEGDHPSVRTPITAFVILPGESRFANERYRVQFCMRHGRAFFRSLYRVGCDSAIEEGEPELCFGCGEPATQIPFEVTLYEDAWYGRFDLVLCEACGSDLPRSLGMAFRTAQRLPDRPKSTQRPSQANRRV